jgi:hypothetical protein
LRVKERSERKMGIRKGEGKVCVGRTEGIDEQWLLLTSGRLIQWEGWSAALMARTVEAKKEVKDPNVVARG